ncbi:endonuclease domain-containing protein [Aureibaculum sp. 2210JD6-5]|uniref:endonuclease domain-containing protein n=1 Tax=Aureibaculum sp. 2210JD6-5 TaxID=3103957 RepID=UPI002AAD269E|nr:endonuclease domain-containing protein [Aureibaculum sp. 2210JD6-5]MDY7394470.1 endonuclease domain-containing protein [Aureibaculum sp. 2210JD6-5]
MAKSKREQNSPSSMKGCPKDGVVDHFIINETKIRKHYTKDLPFNPTLKDPAKQLRKAGNLSEVLFWKQVHKHKFHRIDFDRQRIIGNYIVDFYIKSLSLIIEIDGSSHMGKEDYDAKRQLFLENLGLKFYRIEDVMVKRDLGNVMMGLEEYIIKECGISSLE